MKFQSKPRIVEAVQWFSATGISTSHTSMPDWMSDACDRGIIVWRDASHSSERFPSYMMVKAIHDQKRDYYLDNGFWLIHHESGQLSVMDPIEFEKYFEIVPEKKTKESSEPKHFADEPVQKAFPKSWKTQRRLKIGEISKRGDRVAWTNSSLPMSAGNKIDDKYAPKYPYGWYWRKTS